MTRSRMGLVFGLLLVLALAVAACGGGGKSNGVASLGDGKATTATTSTGGSQDERRAAPSFARCMRAHDIDMSDPDPKTGNMTTGYVTRDQEQHDPAFKAAEAACRDKLPAQERQPRK
jgi:hypothetical protein